MSCDLCNVSPETYIEESQFWFSITCDTCNIPMVVLKQHSSTIYLYEVVDLLSFWRAWYPAYVIRPQARKILDHIHFHLEWES